MKQIVELEQRTNKAPLTEKQTLAADYKNHRAAILCLGRINMTDVENKASIRIQQEADSITAQIDEERRKEEERQRKEAARVAEEKREEKERQRKEAERIEAKRIIELQRPILDLCKESGYECQILDFDEANSHALVITKNCITASRYNLQDIGGISITWTYSTLRIWLNNGFWCSLPENLRYRIPEITSKDSKYAHTKLENDTDDKVFLLSTQEVKQYFPDNASRIAKYNRKPIAWWLRSTDINNGSRSKADYTAIVSSSGSLSKASYSGSKYEHIAVRPAFWVDMDDSRYQKRKKAARTEAERMECLKRKIENDLQTLGHEFLVLKEDKVKNRALFISKDCVATKPYQEKIQRGYLRWGICSLRTWLNTEFYCSLSQSVKTQILDTEVVNTGYEFRTEQRGRDTIDKIFLLSFREVQEYFKSKKDLSVEYQGQRISWWLRSAESDYNNARCVASDGRIGDDTSFDSYRKDNAKEIRGVRPVFWLDFNEK